MIKKSDKKPKMISYYFTGLIFMISIMIIYVYGSKFMVSNAEFFVGYHNMDQGYNMAVLDGFSKDYGFNFVDHYNKEDHVNSREAYIKGSKLMITTYYKSLYYFFMIILGFILCLMSIYLLGVYHAGKN